jgi:hypothetical protein
MNMKPINTEELKTVYRKTTPNEAIIKEFLALDCDAAELEHVPHKTPYVFATSLNQSAKRLNYGVRARVIDGKPYLIKTSVLNSLK